MSSRDLLAKRTGTCPMTAETWFAKNPGARKFVEEWLAMRQTNETDWSSARVFRYLREHKKCPLKAVSAFRRWLEEFYPKQYRSIR